jgi:hypothetical protein
VGLLDASPYAPAIRTLETGSPQGNYASVTDAGNGRKVYGAYQVLGSNIGPWTKEHYGTELTPAQFLQNPAAQDAVFNGQFGQYVSKYGPQGAAMAWHGGPGGVTNPDATDALGASNGGYAAHFAKLMGSQPFGPPAAAPAAPAQQQVSAPAPAPVRGQQQGVNIAPLIQAMVNGFTPHAMQPMQPTQPGSTIPGILG